MNNENNNKENIEQISNKGWCKNVGLKPNLQACFGMTVYVECNCCI